MHAQSQHAYVLHQRPFRDTSAIVDLFTRDHGRITVMAKGVRTMKAGRQRQLQPFILLQVGWRGKGELPLLTHCEPLGFVHVSGDRLTSLLYLNELLLQLLERGDPCPTLFDYYGRTLLALSDPSGPESALRIFEYRLLEELGYGLQLDTEADGVTPIIAGRHYRYIPERGAVVLEATTQGLEITGEELLALRALDGDRLGSRNLKRLLRATMERYLDRGRVKSRELFQVM